MKPPRLHLGTIASIFVIAILLRLFVFAYIAHEPRKFYTYDSDGYDRRAMNLLRYGVFASEKAPPLTPDLDRTPVYPAMLAGVFAVAGHTPAAAILLQILLGSVTALLTYGLARELGLSSRVGVLAALIVAVDPLSIMTANHLLTETLFTLLLVGCIWALARYWKTHALRWLALATVLIALTSLTRPISQFLPLALLPLFPLAAAHGQRRAAAAAGVVFVVASLALTYTWAVRNYREAGIFTLSTISDTNLLYYRARAVLADAEGRSQEEAWKALEQRIEQEATARNLSPAETVALQRQEALKIFQRYPGLTVKMLARGVGRLLVDPGYTITCTQLDLQSTALDCFPGRSSMNDPGVIDKALGKLGSMTLVQQLVLLWSTLLLAILYLGAALGTVRLWRERHWLLLALLVLLLAYFIGLSAGGEANSRFRIPIVPFLAILAGAGLTALYEPIKAKIVGVGVENKGTMGRQAGGVGVAPTFPSPSPIVMGEGEARQRRG
ncbi:MAG TPA: glycosyltransferase family 39 protein [Herpetosiphonaceae bacterium]